MKVSVIQMNMRSLESKANFDRAEALVRRAVGENGPDVVVLPETWNTGFMPAGDLAAACDENAKAVRAQKVEKSSKHGVLIFSAGAARWRYPCPF